MPLQVTTGRGQCTMLHFVELLRGSASSKVQELGHTALPLYGQGKNHSKTDLERLMHLLVVHGILAEDVQIGNHDNLTYVYLQVRHHKGSFSTVGGVTKGGGHREVCRGGGCVPCGISA